MNLYQVDIATDMDTVSLLVNAADENEAIAIALTMFGQGETDSLGTVVVNAAAFPAL